MFLLAKAIGARSPFSGALNLVSSYDVDSNTWRNLSPMPTARAGAAGMVFNNKIYVAGGMLDSGTSSPAFEVFFN